jgi:D-cysteine desulfhydrase family pyridoxal phosphate-dependent enzyme
MLRLAQRIELASLPTRLQPLPRLGAALGLDDLWCKRDDLTDVAGGGNKLRKLEYFMAEARARGAGALVTYGRLQSNHARCTAAAAARCGLRCTIVYQGEAPERRAGNIALASLLGSEIRFTGGGDALAVHGFVRGVVRELEDSGVGAYAIPEGGGDAVGALGFVLAARELAEQCEQTGRWPDAVIIAAGSGGSLAGLGLGLRRWLPGTRLIGASVGPPAGVLARRTAQIANAAARLLHVDERFHPHDFTVLDEWVGAGYGTATAEGDAALLLAARTEGLLLDPVYTAKAAAALAALTARRAFVRSERVIFWHTGGTPGLFARDAWLDEISRTGHSGSPRPRAMTEESTAT